jgi:hypothetical protein
MVDQRGKSYSLFYGTRKMAGLDEMKRAMWKVDRTGGFRFSDRDQTGMTPLFGEAPDLTPVPDLILQRFKGELATIEQVHEFVVAETAYGPDHYRRAGLNKLVKAKKVEVVSSSRKVANGYPPGTVLRFAEA